MDKNKRTLGSIIKLYRTRAGISQIELGIAALGFKRGRDENSAQTKIKRYELDSYKYPKIEEVKKIFEYLGIPVPITEFYNLGGDKKNDDVDMIIEAIKDIRNIKDETEKKCVNIWP